jgi:uncharacterized membrane protein
MRFDWRRDWLPLAAIVVAFIASVVVYPRLPDPMPTHWNFAGEADDYSSRLVGAFMLPLVALGAYFMMFVWPYFDPRRASLMRSSDVYVLMRTAAILFMVYLHGIALYSAATGSTLNNSLVLGGLGVVFLVIGNYMPRIRPNWIAGVRTPWTLSSDSVWRATHRLAGRIFMLGGAVIIFSALLADNVTHIAFFGTLMVVAIIPTLYSLVLFRREQRGSEA